MTLRIILSVRGTLVDGGTFSGTTSSSQSVSSRNTHVISTTRSAGNVPRNPHTFMLDNLGSKPESAWTEGDTKSSVLDGKSVLAIDNNGRDDGNLGVKITIDREVGYDTAYPRGK
jgi:hypothetical protein